MKIKTSEMIGPALRWAVAKAQGYDPQIKVRDGKVRLTYANPVPGTPCPQFDTDWAAGGPIIDREDIDVEHDRDRVFDPEERVEPFMASKPFTCDRDMNYTEYGPTKLIAAMRCFVASKLGDEVDVPEEILS